ncbi:MAG: hypothetical protein R3321_14570 [Nitrososphaeraceae archaeon]|nr:hypothetical protein [Nitrososphaeraceae archaeon]
MSNKNTQNWPDLAIGLYDKLTGRNATINYDFSEFKVGVPQEVGGEATTEWTINGSLSISTSEGK